MRFLLGLSSLLLAFCLDLMIAAGILLNDGDTKDEAGWRDRIGTVIQEPGLWTIVVASLSLTVLGIKMIVSKRWVFIKESRHFISNDRDRPM